MRVRTVQWAAIIGVVVVLVLGGPLQTVAGAALEPRFMQVPNPAIVVRGDADGYGRVGDFTGDGTGDLLLVRGSGIGQVYVSHRDGTFAPPAPPFFVGVDVGRNARVSMADMDGDGRTDLVRVLDGAPSTLLSNGDGTFRPAPGSPDILGTTAPLVIADLNRDGVLDLVFAFSGRTRVALGTGSGAMGATTTLVAEGVPWRVVDADGDGIPDLFTEITVSQFQRVTAVYHGNGDGTFGARFTPEPGHVPLVPPTHDFNGDGVEDEVPYPEGGTVVAVGDVTGDGWADVVALDRDARVVVYVNVTGRAAAQPAPRVAPPPVAGAPAPVPQNRLAPPAVAPQPLPRAATSNSTPSAIVSAPLPKRAESTPQNYSVPNVAPPRR